jgi:hypothetical protein
LRGPCAPRPRDGDDGARAVGTTWCTAWLVPDDVRGAAVRDWCACVRRHAPHVPTARRRRWETLVVVDARARVVVDNRKAKRHLVGRAWLARTTTCRRAARCEETLFPGLVPVARPVFVRGSVLRPPRPLTPDARAAVLDAGRPTVENVCGWSMWPYGLAPSTVTSTRAKMALLAGFRYVVYRCPTGDQFPNTVRVNLPHSTATLFFHARKGVRGYFTGAGSTAAFAHDARFVHATLSRHALLPALRTPPTSGISTMLAARLLRRPVSRAVARYAATRGNGHRDVINLSYVPLGPYVSGADAPAGRTGCSMKVGGRRVMLYGAKSDADVRRLSRALDAFVDEAVAASVRQAREQRKQVRAPAKGGRAVTTGTAAWRRRKRLYESNGDGAARPSTFRWPSRKHARVQRLPVVDRSLSPQRRVPRAAGARARQRSHLH